MCAWVWWAYRRQKTSSGVGPCSMAPGPFAVCLLPPTLDKLTCRLLPIPLFSSCLLVGAYWDCKCVHDCLQLFLWVLGIWPQVIRLEVCSTHMTLFISLAGRLVLITGNFIRLWATSKFFINGFSVVIISQVGRRTHWRSFPVHKTGCREGIYHL